ncbi:MAG: DNA primase [Candidatus Magasanikbacteria bacterium]|nr:DNA primase [Candidatus Magasanikbacteria bacterium]
MSQITDEIKSKINIVEFVSEYLSLKRAGANYRALCPFHHEKTPSFMVSAERQIWHCFGCNSGGDVFGFLMKMEGLEFPEALKMLAEKTGTKLPAFSSEISSSQRNRILDVLKLTAKFYHKILLDSPQAEEARGYLAKRGLTREIIEAFELGFIPEEWDLLTGFLLKKGFGVNDLIAAGLTIKKDGGGFYDRFRGRVMFPIADVHGNFVGFTGRLLKENKPEAGGKYVNTPQTVVYDKSRVIYALQMAKTEAKRQNCVIMVEGQMDAIACHQFGFANTVASSGTALTREQIKLLKRFTDNLFIAFDVDAAGESATERGIDLALAEGMKIKVIAIPEGAGKDPDECLRRNPKIWEEAAAGAQSIMEYFFAKAIKGRDLKKMEERSLAAQKLLDKIKQLPDPVEKDHWIKKLSALLDVNCIVLYEKLAVLTKSPPPPFSKAPEKTSAIVSQSPQEKAAEKLMALLLHHSAFFSLAVEKLKREALPPAFRERFEEMLLDEKGEQQERTDQFIHSSMKQNDSQEFCQTAEILDLLYDKEFAGFSQNQAREETISLINFLNLWYNSHVRLRIQKEMMAAEKEDDKKRAEELMKEFQEFF